MNSCTDTLHAQHNYYLTSAASNTKSILLNDNQTRYITKNSQHKKPKHTSIDSIVIFRRYLFLFTATTGRWAAAANGFSPYLYSYLDCSQCILAELLHNRELSAVIGYHHNDRENLPVSYHTTPRSKPTEPALHLTNHMHPLHFIILLYMNSEFSNILVCQ